MINLKAILDIVSHQVAAAGVDCLLIGGFAVNYHGYTRNTLDVDFMIAAEQLDVVRNIMKQAGFTNIVIEENVAFFSAPGKPGRVDFLRVSPDTMRTLLAHAISANVQGFPLRIPALKDLLAMKIFALSQDIPRRMGKDLADIVYLTVLNHLDLESDLHPLCSQFGSTKTYELIRAQVEALKAP